MQQPNHHRASSLPYGFAAEENFVKVLIFKISKCSFDQLRAYTVLGHGGSRMTRDGKEGLYLRFI